MRRTGLLTGYLLLRVALKNAVSTAIARGAISASADAPRGGALGARRVLRQVTTVTPRTGRRGPTWCCGTAQPSRFSARPRLPLSRLDFNGAVARDEGGDVSDRTAAGDRAPARGHVKKSRSGRIVSQAQAHVVDAKHEPPGISRCDRRRAVAVEGGSMTPSGDLERSRDRHSVRRGRSPGPKDRWLPAGTRAAGRGHPHRQDDARVVPGGIVELDRAVAGAPAEGRP